MNADNDMAEYYDTADLSERIDAAAWEQHAMPAEPMVTYALRLPKPIIDQLRLAAQARNVKVSTLMREWLEERLTIAGRADDDATIPVSALLALVAERGRTTQAS